MIPIIRISRVENGIKKIAVLVLKGPLTGSATGEFLRMAAEKILQERDRHLVINLSCVSDVDDNGVRVLLSAYTMARDKSRECVLSSLSENIKNTSQMPKLLTVFDIFETDEEATNIVASR